GLAEQTGLIEPLTMRLLERALDDWRPPDRHHIPVSVNISPRHLRDPGLPDRIADVLRSRSVDPSALILEVTESVIMSDPAGAIRVLARLHEMGVKLAIDDFG